MYPIQLTDSAPAHLSRCLDAAPNLELLKSHATKARSPWGFPWSRSYPQLDGVPSGYVKIANWKITIFHGKKYYFNGHCRVRKLLVRHYQRVKPRKIPSKHHVSMVFLWFSYGFPMVFSKEKGPKTGTPQPWHM